MRKEKQLLLEEIKDQIQASPQFVLMQYSGLNANVANDFRAKLVGIRGNMEVLRKRMLVKGAEQAGIPIEAKALPGHVGVIFCGGDPIESAKMVINFGKENGDIFKVIGGRFDGQLYTGAEVEKLSTLPDKNGMRAQLLGLFEAPMAQTLAVVDAILCSVIHCVENKRLQDEGSSN